MSYLTTVDERYAGGFLSAPAGARDAPYSIGTAYDIAPGFSNTAYGALVAGNGFADNDLYSLGVLAPGYYSIRASGTDWDYSAPKFGLGFNGATLFDAGGSQIAHNYFGTIDFTVKSSGTYYVGVEGSSFSSSQYQIYYTYKGPLQDTPATFSGGLVGVAAAGKQLVMNFSYFDPDGTTNVSSTNGFSYVWQSSPNGVQWTTIPGINSSGIVIGTSSVGQYIRCIAGFYDDLGFLETFTSSTITKVTPPADTPAVFQGGLRGDLIAGNSLQMNVTFSDADGISAVTSTGPSYSWQTSVDGVQWATLVGITSKSVVIGGADIGKYIRCTISFFDDFGYIQYFTSTGDSKIASPPDTTPPAVVSFNPIDGAQNIPVDQNLTLIFNEAITRGSGDIILKNAAGDVIERFSASSSTELTFAGSVLTIDPALNLKSLSGYSIDIPAGAVKDLAGNSYSGVSKYSFSTVLVPNTAPTATDGSRSVNEDNVLIATLPLSRDDQGDAITYSKASDPAHGTLTIDPTGSYTYRPESNFSGQDSFKFKVSDSLGASNTYTFSIGIASVLDLFLGTAGDDSMSGYPGGDSYDGRGGNDRITGGGGNDTINGGDGFDLVIYSGKRTDASVRLVGPDFTVTTTADGTDTLSNVERLQFQDMSVALDVSSNSNGGKAAEIIRALFGSATLRESNLVGYGVVLLDQGMSYADLVSLAVNTDIFWSKAGDMAHHSNTAFVNSVYKNVVGVLPSATDLNNYVGLLDSGAFTQATLGLLACQTAINSASADLVGLAATGLDYVVPAGLG